MYLRPFYLSSRACLVDSAKTLIAHAFHSLLQVSLVRGLNLDSLRVMTVIDSDFENHH